MNDRIDRKPRVAQSTSKLPVIPPSAAETQIPLATPVAEVDPLQVWTGPAAAPVPPAPRLQAAWQTGAARRMPASPANPVHESDPGWRSIFVSQQGIPSWLISFIFHLLLLILLALLTMGGQDGSRIVKLEMADADSVSDVQMANVVVEFDEEPLVELASDLEESELEAIESESSLDVTRELLGDLKAGMENRNGAEGEDASRLQLARGDGKSVSFFGAGARGNEFVFVIDCSGSMDDEYRWESAKRELKYAIDGLTIDQKYFVFLYNSDTYYMSDRKNAKLLPANEWNRVRTFKWLDAQYPDRDTKPWEAMREALKLQPDAIFLLSDGELKDGTIGLLQKYNSDREESDSREGRKRVPIHTIFLGNGFGEETMRLIAEQNEGSFTRASK